MFQQVTQNCYLNLKDCYYRCLNDIHSSLAPCRHLLQVHKAEVKQNSHSLWFSLNLQCKMKPEHCVTSLFAYLVSFRAVLINTTSRLENHRTLNFGPDSTFLCGGTSLMRPDWRLTNMWLVSHNDLETRHSAGFMNSTQAKIKNNNVASLWLW